MRLFVALALPEDFKAAILTAAAPLKAERGDLRWVPSENLHLTLAFLGEVDERGLEPAIDAARKTAEAFPPFRVAADSYLAFPKPSRARLVAARLSGGTERCAALASYLEDELSNAAAAGRYAFRERERRAFAAHVTVARATAPWIAIGERELALRIQAECDASVLCVFQSELGKGPARYSARASFRLVGRG